jgi:hypothetical protein
MTVIDMPADAPGDRGCAVFCELPAGALDTLGLDVAVLVAEAVCVPVLVDERELVLVDEGETDELGEEDGGAGQESYFVTFGAQGLGKSDLSAQTFCVPQYVQEQNLPLPVQDTQSVRLSHVKVAGTIG